ncbi:MAG: S24/S26 family peptidase [Bacteroidales bacterium]|nr:S24/S26 family peptidase [Bacteroidales bacterium]MBK7626749.1 S24/S26 family peptidase [Bacteroidales bacterium]
MNKYLNKQTLVKDMSLTLLSEGKTIRIKAHGYSMYPCIKPGSMLLIEPIKLKGFPVPGEIIAVKRENGLVVHRLTKIINQDGVSKYVARGDSNAYADKPVNIGMIVGRIVRAETSGENQVLADIRINKRPNYILNRFRVIFIMLKKKIF